MKKISSIKRIIVSLILLSVTLYGSSPIVTTTAITSATEDSLYSYNLGAVDADSDELTWAVKSGTTLPNWLTLESNNSFQPLGSLDFSKSRAQYTDIAIDSNNVPYVVYDDYLNYSKATAMKFDGTNWVNVGDSSGFSLDDASYTSIAIDSNNIPHVAFKDLNASNKATVMKFDGTNWVNVGDAGFSASDADYVDIAIAPNNTPYVVYKDTSVGGGKITVKKLVGNNWVTVGTDGFSDGKVDYTSIAVDSNGTPYIAYTDHSKDEKATVKKFDGTNWVTVGVVGFSEGKATFLSIALDSHDKPYIAFKDSRLSGYWTHKATVMKFDGTNWVNVGDAGFASGVDYTSIAIDANDTPYVAFQNGLTKPVYRGASVMKFDGNSWVDVGQSGFGDGYAAYVSIAIDSKGMPYVAFQNTYQSGHDNKANVYKFGLNYTLSGTPTSSNAGVHDVNLTVSDGENVVSHDFQIIVPKITFDFTIDEDTNKTFAIEDFDLSGIDANHSIIITTLPNKGTLQIEDLNVTLNQSIPLSNIKNLVYKPLANEFGLSYTSFQFKSNDGESNSTVTYSVNIDVTSVNDAPIITSEAITSVDGNGSYSYKLTATDEEGETLSWNIKEGTSLPDGLSLETQNIFQTVGSVGLDWTTIVEPSMVIDSKGTPYVAFIDSENGEKATVIKFDGEKWVAVGGAGFSDDDVDYIDIAIDSNDTLYVVYRDGLYYGGYPTVMKFDGTNWGAVGEPRFGSSAVSKTTIAIDPNGQPYIAYADGSEDWKITVMRYDGTDWVREGVTSGFSSDEVSDISIVFDPNDPYLYPYVLYKTKGWKPSVKKSNGLDWDNVGSTISSYEAFYPSIAIDSQGTLYITYREFGQSSKASVKKFDGTNWVAVGSGEASDGIASQTSIAVDSKGTPYVAFYESEDGKATVKKFDGTNWVIVGSILGKPSDLSIAIDPTTDLPYLLYRDFDVDDYKANTTVMKFDSSTKLFGTLTAGVYDVYLTVTDTNTTTPHNFTIYVEGDVSAINPTVVQGSSDKSTKVTYTPSSGNSLKYMYSNTSVNTPQYGDSAPIEAIDYVSGNDIEGVESGKYLVMYEIKQDKSIIGFYQKVLENKDIYVENNIPTIDTTFSNITILEDSGTINYELNVSDIDGDELNITITSSDTTKLLVMPSWKGLANQATWNQPLDFNVTTQSDASGEVIITITVTDQNGASVRESFTVTIKSVNDAPVLGSISDIYLNKNSKFKSIYLRATDVDSQNLTYNATYTNKELISDISFSENNMTITLVDEYSGTSEVNVTVSDGNLSASNVFQLNVLDGSGLVQKDDENTTEISLEGNVTIKIPKKSDENGTLKSEISLGNHKVITSSEINGSSVKKTDFGISTEYKDTNVSVEINATNLGYSNFKIDTNDTKIETNIQIVGASTVVKKDNGKVAVETTVTNDSNVSFNIIANEDGEASYKVSLPNGKESQVSVNDGNITTKINDNSIELSITSTGLNEMKIITKEDGTNTIEIKNSIGEILSTLGTNASFEADSNVTIEELNGELQMKVLSPLTKPLQF